MVESNLSLHREEVMEELLVELNRQELFLLLTLGQTIELLLQELDQELLIQQGLQLQELTIINSPQPGAKEEHLQELDEKFDKIV